MSKESEINYVLQNIPIDDAEKESGVAYMGYINGGFFANNEGICIITDSVIIFSSEPNALSFLGGSQGQWVVCDWSHVNDVDVKDSSLSCYMNVENKFYSVTINIEEYEINYDPVAIKQRIAINLANVFNYKANDIWNAIVKSEEEKRYADGLSLVKKLRNIDPRTAWSEYLEATYKSYLSDYSDDFLNILDNAERKGWRDILKLDLLRGQYFFFIQDYENAEIYFNKILVFSPDDLYILIFLVDTQINLSKFVEAEKSLKKILRIDSDNILAHYKMLMIALEENEESKIDSSFKKLNMLVNDKFSSDYCEIAAKYYVFKKEYEKALDICSIFIKEERIDDINIAFLILNIYFSLNRYMDAIRFSEKIGTLSEEQQFMINLYKVISYFELGDFDSISRHIDKLNAAYFLKSLVLVFQLANNIEKNKNYNQAELINKCRNELKKDIDNKIFQESEMRGYYYYIDYYEAICCMKNNQKENAIGLLKNTLKIKIESPGDKRLCDNAKEFLDKLLIEKETSSKPAKEKTAKEENTDSSVSVFQGSRNNTLKNIKKIKKIFDENNLFNNYKDAVSNLISEYDRPFLLTVLGEFNAGKSTFINAILGEELLSVGDIPTTATISLLKYSDKKSAKIIWHDETTEEISIDMLRKYTVEKREDAENDVLRKIKYVEISYPSEMLKKIWIVDTPGLNAIIPEHKEVTNDFIKKCDGIAWLFCAQQAGKQNELNALTDANDYSSKTIGVINQIDKVDPEERAELVQYIADKFNGLISNVFAISAKKALEGRVRGDKDKLSASKIELVEKILREDISEKSKILKEESVQQKTKFYSEEGLKAFREYENSCAAINTELSFEKQKVEKVRNCISEATYNKIMSEEREALSAIYKLAGKILENSLKTDNYDNTEMSKISLQIKNALNNSISRISGAMVNEPRKLIEQLIKTIESISSLNIDEEIKKNITIATIMYFTKAKEVDLHLNALKEYNRGRLESNDLMSFYFNELSRNKSISSRDIAALLADRFSYNEAKIDKIIKEWSKDLTEILINLITIAEEEIRARIEHEKIVVVKPLKNIVSEIVSSTAFFQKEIDLIKFESGKQNSVLELLFKIIGIVANANGFHDKEELAVKNIIKEMDLDSDQVKSAMSAFNSSFKKQENVKALASMFYEKHADKKAVLEKTFSILFKIASADNNLSKEEEMILKEISSIFKINEKVYNCIKEAYFKGNS